MTNAEICKLLRMAHDALSISSMPPKREWVGLTDEEIVSTLRRDDIELTHFCSAIQAKDFTNDYLTKVMTLFMQQEGFYFARAIEEKLKEKNS